MSHLPTTCTSIGARWRFSWNIQQWFSFWNRKLRRTLDIELRLHPEPAKSTMGAQKNFWTVAASALAPTFVFLVLLMLKSTYVRFGVFDDFEKAKKWILDPFDQFSRLLCKVTHPPQSFHIPFAASLDPSDEDEIKSRPLRNLHRRWWRALALTPV